MKARVDCTHVIALQEDTPQRGNLFLGSVSVFDQHQAFKERHIDCVLSILDDSTAKRFKVAEKIEHLKISISHRINLLDDEECSIKPHFAFTYEFLKKHLENNNVFVHCRGGVSRSVSIVLAFLMRQMQWSYQEARIYLKKKRRGIWPNSTFEKELIEFEKTLH